MFWSYVVAVLRKAADAALDAHPDRLTSAVGSLVAARGSLAEGRTRTALETIERARRGRPPAPLLDRVQLNLLLLRGPPIAS